jgi:endonuclease/exonuclease/phosphatase family metal-dependent hydrolase
MNLSVLQWNVWFREAADNIIGFVKEVDADILCLQELTTHSKVNRDRNIPAEIAKLGYEYYYEKTIQRSDINLGNGIFSKYPITSKRHVYIQHEDKEIRDYTKENRIFVEVTININGQELTVGTIHLSYSDYFTITDSREKEFQQLLNAISQNKNRFILTGDFNAEPESKIIKLLDDHLVNAGPDYKNKSWTTKPFVHNDFKADTLDWRLDYVFTSRDLKVLSSDILKTD